MAESLCPCCTLLGKPRARVNFLLLTGLPKSFVRDQIRWLLTHHSDTQRTDVDLTNYQALADVSAELFNQTNQSSSSRSSTTATKEECCHKLCIMHVNVDDMSNSSQWERFKERILDKLAPKPNPQDEKAANWCEPPSWIVINDSKCLEPNLLNIFLQLDKHTAPLLSFTYTILCLLGDEQQLFKNCVLRCVTFYDYESIMYPDFERIIGTFFSLLNSSKVLQQHTLLFEQNKVSDDDKLRLILKQLFSHDTSTNQEPVRRYMSNLLSPCRRTVRDIRNVRQDLQNYYNKHAYDRLKPLLDSLQQRKTTEDAARQIVHIVLSDFERMNDEEKRVYRRKFVLGFETNDAQHKNTIAAQLVLYAMELLNKTDESMIPFFYSIILTICSLGSHYFFRHELFNNTPEIYTLSMLLVCQRQYALVLAGLRLCKTILNGDQVEHKYAIAYSKHDPQVVRKLLDAIKWLLTPYDALILLWEKECQENVSDTIQSDEQELPSKLAERHCFRHAAILAGRQHVRCLAALLHGSIEHCTQVTIDDVEFLVKATKILADNRLASWSQSGRYYSLAVIGDLCAILTPILQYSSLDVSLVLRRANLLLKTISDTIYHLFRVEYVESEVLDACVRFYILLVETKRKDLELAEDSDSEEATESITVEEIVPIIDSPNPLILSRDLIVSYFHLHRHRQQALLDDEKSGRTKTRTLLDMQWQKFDTIQLSHDNERLKQENDALRQEMKQLRNELQRTQFERDQFQKDNTRLAQEIDRVKLILTENSMIQAPSSSIPVSIVENNEEKMIDQFGNLSPHEITTEQAEKFIREIHRRRTTFNDHDMRLSICGSLKHLGSDLYTSPVHFLHELIQNAEDNVYNSTVIPRLRIELNHGYILLSNNEQGLRTKDVLAICSLAVSTKRLDEHIGEKGVGFKSVFAASNQPTLISHAWKFAFHVSSSDAMSYISPVWLSDQDIPEQIRCQIATNSLDTHLYLPLKLQPNTPAAKDFLNQVTRAVDPCILLTLHRLKSLEIADERHGQVTIIDKQTIESSKQTSSQSQTVTFENLTFVNLTGSLIQLHTAKTGCNRFRVYTCIIEVPSTIEQQRKTRLTLAFPCENDYSMAYTVYTGLPVCDLGFNFLLDADFQLVTNRESVRENVPFNGFLRDHLAVLFVYLLLNDIDIRKNLNHYCPSSMNSHSSWWLIMIDRINELITKHLSSLFDIHRGKAIRRFNIDLAEFASNEQLYDCADIQVINPTDGILTEERLKTFQVQPVSFLDVLNCLPDQNEELNQSRQQFKIWTQKQNQNWWDHLFQYMAQTMTDSIADCLLRKPIFSLQTEHSHRQYLPTKTSSLLLLFISDDPSFRMWKQKLTLLKYHSTSEQSALLRSNHVQLLTEERMIEIILCDHLQIALSSSDINEKQIEEVWQDLLYLRSRTDKVNKPDRFLVPVSGSKKLAAIQDATLPTLLSMDIRSLLFTPPPTLVLLPYNGISYNQLDENLQWEYFLLEMNCQSPSIRFEKDFSITQLPLLPCFTKFVSEPSVRLAQFIFSKQSKSTQECLQQFPVVAHVNECQEISPVSTTFDEAIIHDLSSLPRVTFPSHCRSLAITLGVRVDCDLRTCVTVLQLLSNEKNTNLDLYVQWLGHLQLYVRQQHTDIDSLNLLSSCQIYLPDQQKFRSLKDLLVVSDYDKHRETITLVAKYIKLHLISSSINHIYWQFKGLFQILGCTCTINISHILTTIQLASRDKNNFHALGDCKTILKDTGVEALINLIQYLEHLILEWVHQNKTNSRQLFDAIVERRHPTAPCGSREDWQWRFQLTCNSLSKQLRVSLSLTHQKKIPLLTIDRKLVIRRTNTIVYACMEQKIIQHLAKDIGKRYFISPLIVRTCPLVLSAFGIDYVERRGQVLWEHKNNNLEYHLDQLTKLFRDRLKDSTLEVITSKYASVKLLLSDLVILDPNSNDNDEQLQIDRYIIDIDFPFWVFNNTILLCVGFVRDDATKSVVATSALATLLHKRRYVPFEEAKSIARQTIDKCSAFRSNRLANNVASTEATTYSYIDLVFPTHHHTIELRSIMIGKQFNTEEDPEDDDTRIVAPDRAIEDRIYQNRMRDQNHTRLNQNQSNRWIDPTIVDNIEQLRIGQNAEHFFFVYLQKLYGTTDVTPIRNWCSSARLTIYPQITQNVNDLIGYDFALQDTREEFVCGSGSKTKQCYFEIKGTSGLFDEAKTRFHISQNEFNTCRAIAHDQRRLEREAYLIVIIQDCLDPEKISLGRIIDWSGDFNSVRRTIDSYTCSLALQSSLNSNDTWEERRNQIPNSNRYVILQNQQQDDAAGPTGDDWQTSRRNIRRR